MNTANPGLVLKLITIKNIELCTPPEELKIPVAKQFSVKFTITNAFFGDAAQESGNAKELKNHRTSWEKALRFVGYDSSILEIYVYLVGKDEPIGSLSGVIKGFSRKLKDGVFEAILDTRNGSDFLGATIKFAFATGVDTVQTFQIIQDVLTKRVDETGTIHPSLPASLDKHPLEARSDRDKRIVRLVGAMSGVFSLIENAKELRTVEQHRTITLLLRQVTECGCFITEYAKPDFWTRTTKFAASDVDVKIRDYEDNLRDLKTDFLNGITAQVGASVIRMARVIEDIAGTITLNELPYARGARYAREKERLPGTHEALLLEICDILNAPADDAPRVCLLTGVAGSGKSTVAHSIARLYDEKKRLGSSYCFARSDLMIRNPSNFFSTIARDLCDLDPQYKTAVLNLVKGDCALRMSVSPFEQLERFIVEPSHHLHSLGPLVIVIDALDESGDSAGRQQLLQALNQMSNSDLSANLRFLITARPERDILAALPPGPRVIHKQMSNTFENASNGDIKGFICFLYRCIYAWTMTEFNLPMVFASVVLLLTLSLPFIF